MVYLMSNTQLTGNSYGTEDKKIYLKNHKLDFTYFSIKFITIPFGLNEGFTVPRV